MSRNSEFRISRHYLPAIRLAIYLPTFHHVFGLKDAGILVPLAAWRDHFTLRGSAQIHNRERNRKYVLFANLALEHHLKSIKSRPFDAPDFRISLVDAKRLERVGKSPLLSGGGTVPRANRHISRLALVNEPSRISCASWQQPRIRRECLRSSSPHG